MKKSLLLAALLTLLALPSFVLAETWAEFVDLANAAMEGQEGEVSLRAPALVTAHEEWKEPKDAGVPLESMDKPLVVPDNVQLTIQGGRFEIMVLGGGDITLSGVTVNGLPDTDVILMLPQGKEGRLKLIIGEDSTVTASGTGRALSVTNWQKAGSLEVSNLGQITAETRACVDIRLTPESGNALLRFLNAGSIRGGEYGVLLLVHPEKGAGSVSMENTGNIYAAGEAAVWLTARSDKKGAFATLENQGGATIDQSGAEGAAAIMEVTDTASGKNNGQGLIINKGIIRATSEPIRLMDQGDALVPVRIQQSGLVEEASGKIAPAAYVYVSASKSGTLKAEELEALGQEWATALNLGAMAAGTRMELVYLGLDGQEKDRVTMRSENVAVRNTMAWSDFRAWADEQMTLSPGEELRLYVNADVGAPKGMDSGRDKGLTIPNGKKLVLVGGNFEQIMLANGDLELSGSEAQAIYIPAGDDTVRVTLTIDADSTVTATGEGGWAIFTDEKHKKSCAITVINQGRLEGETGVISLAATVVGEREINLTVENQGKILSRGQAVRMFATTQDSPAYLTLKNDGVIESTGANAVEITGLSSRNSCWFLVQNGPDANLHCSTGNTLYIRTLDPTAPATNPRERVPELEEPWGSVIIENQGKIGGKEEPIQVESLLRALFPVEVKNAGTVTVRGEEAEFLLTVLYHAEKESRIIAQEEFEDIWRVHVQSEYQLPDGLRAWVRLRVPATAQIPEDLYMYPEDM